MSARPPSEYVESVSWESAHYEEPFHTQRTAKLPGKLKRLGVLDLPLDARILDTCCGKGEALQLLHSRGYTNLAGADGLNHPEWANFSECEFASCNVKQMPFADKSFDAIMNLHALHHLDDRTGVREFLTECFRLLKPGGKLYILDFPGSPQINLVFWALRKRLGAITPGLRNFATILDEEWSYLGDYLADWPAVQRELGSTPFRVKSWQRDVFLYFLCLEKPNSSEGETTGDDSVGAEESQIWKETYTDGQQRERRRREAPKKLARLGVTRLPRTATTVDLCCGSGETLEALWGLGFRDLHGVDITAYSGIAHDPRFQFHQSDVRSLPFADNSVDLVLNVHAMHHLQTASNVDAFLQECYRVLRPGGRLAIIDFANSPQIQLAFRFFLVRPLLVTPYLRWFGKLIHSEWYFLEAYLAEWPQTRRLLERGPFEVAFMKNGFFYFYLGLIKPIASSKALAEKSSLVA